MSSPLILMGTTCVIELCLLIWVSSFLTASTVRRGLHSMKIAISLSFLSSLQKKRLQKINLRETTWGIFVLRTRHCSRQLCVCLKV